MRRINRTNAAAVIDAGGTLTDALARRDAPRHRHYVVTTAADAAAGATQPGYSRQLRSELKMLSALPVADLRAQADVLARELREVDAKGSAGGSIPSVHRSPALRTGDSTQHITACRFVTMRAGAGHPPPAADNLLLWPRCVAKEKCGDDPRKVRCRNRFHLGYRSRRRAGLRRGGSDGNPQRFR
ncbi:hypothetical protein OK015_20885 [Mycobacterium sp. Aquia_216]|nr:hypothetical protein OK015_20885 [Mycobacterium sp. Aquia_216]